MKNSRLTAGMMASLGSVAAAAANAAKVTSTVAANVTAGPMSEGWSVRAKRCVGFLVAMLQLRWRSSTSVVSGRSLLFAATKCGMLQLVDPQYETIV
jgi:hypothetical protein